METAVKIVMASVSLNRAGFGRPYKGWKWTSVSELIHTFW